MTVLQFGGYIVFLVVIVVCTSIFSDYLWGDIPDGEADKLSDTPGPVKFAELSAKNPDLSNEEQGLYRKFHIYRADGSSALGQKHDGCEYFVLDLTHDPYALETLAYYAKACKETHPFLYSDLMTKVRAEYQLLEDKGRA